MKSEIWESFFTNFRCRRLIHCKIFDFPYFYKTCSRRQKVWETIIPISVCSSYRGIPLYPGGSVAVWWSGSDWDCCQRSAAKVMQYYLLYWKGLHTWFLFLLRLLSSMSRSSWSEAFVVFVTKHWSISKLETDSRHTDWHSKYRVRSSTLSLSILKGTKKIILNVKSYWIKRVLVSHLDLQHGRNFLAKSRKALEIFQLVKGVVIFFFYFYYFLSWKTRY